MGVVSAIGNAVSSGVQSIGNAFADVDKTVNREVPGGWITVGAAAAGAGALGYGALAGAAEGASALTTSEILGGAGGTFVPTAGSGASFVLPEALGSTAAGLDVFGGLAGTEGAYGGLTAAEQAAQLTGAAGSVGPTYAELGYQGANAKSTMDAIAAADAASKVAAGDTLTKSALAKKALQSYALGSQGLKMLGPQASPAGYGSTGAGGSYGITAPSTVNMGGVTGYSGTMPTSSNFSVYTPTLSKIRGATGDLSYAAGGITTLGSYSDGGRLLKGPGDGMSDHIPAKIGEAQPARLADGEFVVPADVVSHLGNGSTDAGAKQLYAMMDKVRKARTGTKKQGKRINPSKYLP